MADNPYRIPDDDRLYMVHTSGGRTSAFLLAHVLASHGGELPHNAVAAFANTGKEHDATLDFLHQIETRWRVPLVWLEYRHHPDRPGGRAHPKHDVAIVDYETAARAGEPFAAMIAAKGYLPNPTQRICTSVLKVDVADWYSRRRLGWPRKKVRHLLGMRYDEPQRVRTALFETCDTLYPLYDARVTKSSVNAWWARRPFNLRIPERLGNCDGCFLKGRKKLLQIFREDPGRAKWWIEQESVREQKGRQPINPRIRQFRTSWSYTDLAMEASGTLLPEVFAPEDEEDMPCFCGS